MEIEIKSDLQEQEFMESLLNMSHSGYKVLIPLGFYALCNSWHIDKLNYYFKLLELKNWQRQ